MARLTIKLTTSTIHPPLEAFVEALRYSHEILRDLDASVSGKPQGSLQWRIADLRIDSAVATLEAEPLAEEADVGPSVVEAYANGLEQIEQTPTIPRYFTEDTLEKTKRLVGVLSGEVTKITVTVPGMSPVSVTQRVAANVDEMIGPQHEAMGSLEGTLETLSVHGRPYFTIYEVLTRRGIRCSFPDEMIDEAHRAFRNRVAVVGRIKYTKTGQPVSIAVEHLRVLRRSQQLPQAKDIEGINLTEQVDPTEYIRRLRDAQ